MKKCGKCGVEKPLDNYYKLKRSERLFSYCKQCVRIVDKQNKAKKKQNQLDTKLYLAI